MLCFLVGVHVARLFSFQCCVVWLCFVCFCPASCVLNVAVSLDFSFLIAHFSFLKRLSNLNVIYSHVSPLVGLMVSS